MGFQQAFISSLLVMLISGMDGVIGVSFTFVNKCEKTVWPGILGNPGLGSTGFELPQGSSRSFQAPTGWSGRFWGRTGCNFDGSSNGSCTTGDCGSGQVECNGSGATPPATLAEFTLGSGSLDFYDVSLVDGYNLPMLVEASGSGTGSCGSTGCIEDLNQICPTELRVEGGGACRSACDAFGTAQYCCKGEFASPATCAPSIYSQIFKSACPKSYSYAYDDKTSTFTCSAADYTITFCPSSLSRQKATNTNNGSRDGGLGGSGSEESWAGSESGSAGSMEAMLANGAWMANLATGSSIRRQKAPCVSVHFLILFFATSFILQSSLMGTLVQLGQKSFL